MLNRTLKFPLGIEIGGPPLRAHPPRPHRLPAVQPGHRGEFCPNGQVDWIGRLGERAFRMRPPMYWSEDPANPMNRKTAHLDKFEHAAKAWAQERCKEMGLDYEGERPPHTPCSPACRSSLNLLSCSLQCAELARAADASERISAEEIARQAVETEAARHAADPRRQAVEQAAAAIQAALAGQPVSMQQQQQQQAGAASTVVANPGSSGLPPGWAAAQDAQARKGGLRFCRVVLVGACGVLLRPSAAC